MRNRFKGKCLVCKEDVKVGEGYFQRITNGLKNYGIKKWEVRCKSCVGMGNKQLTYPIKEDNCGNAELNWNDVYQNKKSEIIDYLTK